MLFLLPQVFIAVVVINKKMEFLMISYRSMYYLSTEQCNSFVILFAVEYYLSSFPNICFVVQLVVGY